MASPDRQYGDSAHIEPSQVDQVDGAGYCHHLMAVLMQETLKDIPMAEFVSGWFDSTVLYPSFSIFLSTFLYWIERWRDPERNGTLKLRRSLVLRSRSRGIRLGGSGVREAGHMGWLGRKVTPWYGEALADRSYRRRQSRGDRGCVFSMPVVSGPASPLTVDPQHGARGNSVPNRMARAATLRQTRNHATEPVFRRTGPR